MLLPKVPEAGTDLPIFIELEDVPTLIVHPDFVASIGGQFVRTNGAIPGIDSASKTLHLGHETAMPPFIDCHIPKGIRNGAPGRRQNGVLRIRTNR
jgi:hypothetical protein